MFSINSNHIVYEDQSIIAVNKPAGLPSQKTTNPKKQNLFDELKKFLNEREHSPCYLSLHHRLDAATSGLILLGKDPRANKNLSSLFQERKIEKTYLALAHNFNKKEVEESWETCNFLSTYKQGAFKKAKVSKKGQEAITKFKLIKRSENYVLLECQPVTGRLHQIRVQLSHLKLPIVGDFLYGRKTHHPLMLHSLKLAFPHPTTKDKLNLHCTADWDFDSFVGQQKK